MSLNHLKNAIVALSSLFVLALAFQNCSDVGFKSNYDSKTTDSSRGGQLSIICPENLLEVDCRSNETEVLLTNEFGCTYTACRMNDDVGGDEPPVVSCPNVELETCGPNHNMVRNTDENGCETITCEIKDDPVVTCPTYERQTCAQNYEEVAKLDNEGCEYFTCEPKEDEPTPTCPVYERQECGPNQEEVAGKDAQGCDYFRCEDKEDDDPVVSCPVYERQECGPNETEVTGTDSDGCDYIRCEEKPPIVVIPTNEKCYSALLTKKVKSYLDSRDREHGTKVRQVYKGNLKKYFTNTTEDSYGAMCNRGNITPPCTYHLLSATAEIFSRELICNDGEWEPTGRADNVNTVGISPQVFSRTSWRDMDFRDRFNSVEGWIHYSVDKVGLDSQGRGQKTYIIAHHEDLYRKSYVAGQAVWTTNDSRTGFYLVDQTDGFGDDDTNNDDDDGDDNTNDDDGDDNTGDDNGDDDTTTANCTADPFICNIYRTALNRLPDQGGARYYTDRIRFRVGTAAKNAEKVKIENEIKSSPEATGQVTTAQSFQNANYRAFNAKFGMTTALCTGSVNCTWEEPQCTADSFICEVYARHLKRIPDQAGAKFYTDLISTKTTMSSRNAIKSTIESDIQNSQEANGTKPFLPAEHIMCAGNVHCPGPTGMTCLDQYSDEICVAYNHNFNRIPEQEGANYWQAALDNPNNGINKNNIIGYVERGARNTAPYMDCDRFFNKFGRKADSPHCPALAGMTCLDQYSDEICEAFSFNFNRNPEPEGANYWQAALDNPNNNINKNNIIEAVEKGARNTAPHMDCDRFHNKFGRKARSPHCPAVAGMTCLDQYSDEICEAYSYNFNRNPEQDGANYWQAALDNPNNGINKNNIIEYVERGARNTAPHMDCDRFHNKFGRKARSPHCPEVRVCNQAVVCGVNGQNYSNNCAAEDAGVAIDYVGQCRPQNMNCLGQYDDNICAAYQSNFNRQPASGGANYWQGQIDNPNNNITRNNVAASIISGAQNSGNHKDCDVYFDKTGQVAGPNCPGLQEAGYRKTISGYYTQYFQRPADDAGLNYWVGEAMKGQLLDSIRDNAFRRASECKQSCL